VKVIGPNAAHHHNFFAGARDGHVQAVLATHHIQASKLSRHFSLCVRSIANGENNNVFFIALHVFNIFDHQGGRDRLASANKFFFHFVHHQQLLKLIEGDDAHFLFRMALARRCKHYPREDVYGRALTQSIKEGKIKKAQVPAYVARQLRRVVGNGFVEVWGPIDQVTGDKAVAYKRYQHLLKDPSLATADIANGKILFQRTCSACHTLNGEGGKLGPDLTGSNRSNINYLLSNLIEPSSEIQDDYKMVVITSRDGRTYSGNVIAENERQVTLRVVGQDQLVLNKSDIQSREVATSSLMPERLLGTLTDREVVDLIGYLRRMEESF
jgi:putative heme-binding domain-containing protein